MQLTFEAVRRADGRIALLHGDRIVGHLAPDALRSGPAPAVRPVAVPAGSTGTVGDAAIVQSGMTAWPETPSPRRHPAKKAAVRRADGVDWKRQGELRDRTARAIARAGAKARAARATIERATKTEGGTGRMTNAKIGRPKLTKDDPRVRQAQQLFDAGRSPAEVARRVGVSTTCLKGWRTKQLLTFGDAGRRGRRLPPLTISPPPAPQPVRGTKRPTRASGPTLKDLAEEVVEDATRRCPVCGEATSGRYCPNNHDVLLDGPSDEDPLASDGDDDDEAYD